MYSLMVKQVFLLLIICLVRQVFGNVIVDTNSGKVEGKEINSIIKNEKYYSFFGIPYAQAPVGKLRFMPPVPHPGWEDVLEATKEKKHCAQYNLPVRGTERYGYCGDEDCLHLNIHTPSLPENNDLKLPIIVFLYNELFKVSYNGTKDYRPDFFMEENVIIITINHRLGALGFLSFEDKLLPGNNGIRDIILALKWIKKNIVYFGGDPSRVTLMGNSGGAALVDILIYSPKAKGLFSAAILQSGSSRNPHTIVDKPKQRAITLSEELERKATTSESLIERLSDITAFEITENEFAVVHADEARGIQKGVTAFGPVLEIDHDDAVLTKLPEETSMDITIPVMIGFNSRESIESNSRYLRMPQYLTYADRDFLMLFPIRASYHFQINDKIYNAMIDELKKFYFKEGYVKIGRVNEYITYIDDMMTIYPTTYTVKQYSNTSRAPVYHYMFDYSGELSFRKKMVLTEATSFVGTWGASVGDDLCYSFMCTKYRKTYRKLLESEESEEIKILRTMVKMYTNFARTGNPTPPGSDFIWTPATKEDRECLVISDELKIVPKLYDERIKFWDSLIKKYSKMAVNGVVKDIKDEL